MYCGPLSEMIRGRASGYRSFARSQDALHIRFRHRLTNLPVNHRAARTIQKRAEVVERPTQVQVRDIRVPVLVRSQRLNEARSLLRRLRVPTVQTTRLRQHPVRRRGANCHHVFVQHHERESAIPVQWVAVEVVDHGLALPFFDPVIPRHQAVVLIHLPVPLAPVVELAPSDPAPLNDLLDRKLGLGGDCVHEVDNLVTTVMGNPGTTQASPSFFLSVTYSSVTSAMI